MYKLNNGIIDYQAINNGIIDYQTINHPKKESNFANKLNKYLNF